ncbi:unnamed protein product, partial [Amoebophrya sp. A120]
TDVAKGRTLEHRARASGLAESEAAQQARGVPGTKEKQAPLIIGSGEEESEMKRIVRPPHVQSGPAASSTGAANIQTVPQQDNDTSDNHDSQPWRALLLENHERDSRASRREKLRMKNLEEEREREHRAKNLHGCRTTNNSTTVEREDKYNYPSRGQTMLTDSNSSTFGSRRENSQNDYDYDRKALTATSSEEPAPRKLLGPSDRQLQAEMRFSRYCAVDQTCSETDSDNGAEYERSPFSDPSLSDEEAETPDRGRNDINKQQEHEDIAAMDAATNAIEPKSKIEKHDQAPPVTGLGSCDHQQGIEPRMSQTANNVSGSSSSSATAERLWPSQIVDGGQKARNGSWVPPAPQAAQTTKMPSATSSKCPPSSASPGISSATHLAWTTSSAPISTTTGSGGSVSSLLTSEALQRLDDASTASKMIFAGAPPDEEMRMTMVENHKENHASSPGAPFTSSASGASSAITTTSASNNCSSSSPAATNFASYMTNRLRNTQNEVFGYPIGLTGLRNYKGRGNLMLMTSTADCMGSTTGGGSSSSSGINAQKEHHNSTLLVQQSKSGNSSNGKTSSSSNKFMTLKTIPEDRALSESSEEPDFFVIEEKHDMKPSRSCVSVAGSKAASKAAVLSKASSKAAPKASRSSGGSALMKQAAPSAPGVYLVSSAPESSTSERMFSSGTTSVGATSTCLQTRSMEAEQMKTVPPSLPPRLSMSPSSGGIRNRSPSSPTAARNRAGISCTRGSCADVLLRPEGEVELRREHGGLEAGTARSSASLDVRDDSSAFLSPLRRQRKPVPGMAGVHLRAPTASTGSCGAAGEALVSTKNQGTSTPLQPAASSSVEAATNQPAYVVSDEMKKRNLKRKSYGHSDERGAPAQDPCAGGALPKRNTSTIANNRSTDRIVLEVDNSNSPSFFSSFPDRKRPTAAMTGSKQRKLDAAVHLDSEAANNEEHRLGSKRSPPPPAPTSLQEVEPSPFSPRGHADVDELKCSSSMAAASSSRGHAGVPGGVRDRWTTNSILNKPARPAQSTAASANPIIVPDEAGRCAGGIRDVDAASSRALPHSSSSSSSKRPREREDSDTVENKTCPLPALADLVAVDGINSCEEEQITTEARRPYFAALKEPRAAPELIPAPPPATEGVINGRKKCRNPLLVLSTSRQHTDDSSSPRCRTRSAAATDDHPEVDAEELKPLLKV